MSPLTEPTRLVLRKDSVAATDTNIREVSLLLHGNGTNGSTTITDSSLTPKTVTAVGNAQISTAQSKFGGGSIAFDGAGDYLTLVNDSSYNLTADFTIEAWARKTANGANGYDGLVGTSQGSNSFVEISSIRGVFVVTANNSESLSYSYNPNDSAWHHYAVVKSGATLRIFIDGVSVASRTVIGGLDLRNAFIGRYGGIYDFNGYIDDLRITKGVARYTANFTPPTAPFPDF